MNSPNKVATLRDVAEMAQVSVATASHALTGVGRVSDRTRARVAAVARGLGYVPNATARGLRGGRTNMVGLYLHPNATHLVFHHRMVMAAFDAASTHGYDVALIGPSNLSRARLRARVDGLIISDPFFDHGPTLDVLESGLPVVAVGRTDPNMPPPAVVIQADHDRALLEVLEKMSAEGVRRPSLIMSVKDYPSFWTKMITSTFGEWCARQDIQPDVQPLAIDAGAEDIDQAVAAILEREPTTDGIILGRDSLAVRVTSYLHSHGRRVGGDIAMAALNDEPMLQQTIPSVTAIDLDPPRYFGLAVELLLARLEGKETPSEVVHRVGVNFRESTELRRR